MIRPQQRLRSRADFQRVFATRAAVSDACMVVHGCVNPLGYARLGISVSRRIGNAVRRNRWKRIVREAFRLSTERLPAGLDMVVVVRSPTVPTLQEAQTAIVALTARLQRRLRSQSRPRS